MRFHDSFLKSSLLLVKHNIILFQNQLFIYAYIMNWRTIHLLHIHNFFLFLYLRNRLHRYNKRSSFPRTLTLYMHLTSHFFYESLAYTQAQTCALLVYTFRIRQFTEIQKKFAYILLADSHPWIFNSYLEWNIILIESCFTDVIFL